MAIFKEKMILKSNTVLLLELSICLGLIVLYIGVRVMK